MTRADIHPTAVIEGDVIIGARSRVFPFAVIGTDGEHRRARPIGWIRIGDDVTVREHVAIQRGTGDRETTIGHRVMLMHNSHVAHDCVVEDDVTITPNVVLGGHTRVHVGATIGIGAMTHQFSTIGAYAMIGMGAVITRDVPPFALVMGNPARFARLNKHALDALGITDARIEDGALVSAHPVVVTALEHFRADSRRKPLNLFVL